MTISRASGTLTFPANFMLIVAMNPCPCGYLGDPVKECTCSQMMITRYRPASLRGFPCLIDGRTAPSVTAHSLASLKTWLRPADGPHRPGPRPSLKPHLERRHRRPRGSHDDGDQAVTSVLVRAARGEPGSLTSAWESLDRHLIVLADG